VIRRFAFATSILPITKVGNLLANEYASAVRRQFDCTLVNRLFVIAAQALQP
jgi:hypothetical protein